MPRVLVVDDDPNMRDLLSIRLRKAGHRVLCAESGAEALQLVETRGAPDVAVLDVTMPGMTGLELLPAMRACDGLDVGLLDATYLTKPFSGIALINAIAAAVEDDGGW